MKRDERSPRIESTTISRPGAAIRAEQIELVPAPLPPRAESDTAWTRYLRECAEWWT